MVRDLSLEKWYFHGSCLRKSSSNQTNEIKSIYWFMELKSAGIDIVGTQSMSPTEGGTSRNVPSFIQQTFIQFPFHASLLLVVRVLQCIRFGASLVDSTIRNNLPLQERRKQC